jgi:hypothetical protein
MEDKLHAGDIVQFKTGVFMVLFNDNPSIEGMRAQVDLVDDKQVWFRMYVDAVSGSLVGTAYGIRVDRAHAPRRLSSTGARACRAAARRAARVLAPRAKLRIGVDDAQAQSARAVATVANPKGDTGSLPSNECAG